MGTSRYCYEAGLFTTGVLWGDKAKNLAQFEVVAEQAKSSLVRLGIKTDIIDRITFPKTKAADVSSRLRWVAKTSVQIREELANKIEAKHGTAGSKCFQTGIHLGNLMFATALFNKSALSAGNFDTIETTLSPYIRNLRMASIAIGSPQILEELIETINGYLSTPHMLVNVTGIPSRASKITEYLAVWLDTNVQIKKEPSKLWRVLIALIKKIPYVGEALVELFERK